MIKFHTERNILLSDYLKIIKYQEPIETLLKKRFPNREITFTNYGRTALGLILKQYQLEHKKVIIPGYICPLFDEIIKEYKIEPIYADVDKNTFNISKKTISALDWESSSAIITNNMNGLPCQIKEIKKFLSEKILIEDCAHSLGAKHKEKLVGTFGNATFFSLYKNLPTISGGFAISEKPLQKLEREQDIIKTIPKLIYFTGKTANLYRSIKSNPEEYKQKLIFENIELKKPNKIIEKLSVYYLSKLDEIIKKRKKIGNELRIALKKNGFEVQKDDDQEHIYTYFGFLLPEELKNNRDKILNELEKEGIIGKLIWNQLPKDVKEDKCPNAINISERILGIPINSKYTKEETKILKEKILNVLVRI